jgi:hypothetical protein
MTEEQIKEQIEELKGKVKGLLAQCTFQYKSKKVTVDELKEYDIWQVEGDNGEYRFRGTAKIKINTTECFYDISGTFKETDKEVSINNPVSIDNEHYSPQ